MSDFIPDDDSTEDLPEYRPMTTDGGFKDTAHELGRLSAEVSHMIRQNQAITRKLSTIDRGLQKVEVSIAKLKSACGSNVGTTALQRQETVGAFFGRLAKKALEIVIVSAIVAGIVAALGSAYFKSQITEAMTSSHNQGG